MGENNWKLDDSNELLKYAYLNGNYREEIINYQNDLCYIFFSGNGLYYPDKTKVFEEVILKADCYEWTEIAKSDYIRGIAGKYIFVRDIFKSWYVMGINHTINTISKLVEALKQETIKKGYRVRTVGNSAGGYMAALVGALINAEMVFDFSGQFSLYVDGSVDLYYFLSKYRGEERSRYYDIVPYIEGNVPIMYYFPRHCEDDLIQSELIRDVENVYSFAFDEKVHGKTMKGRDIPIVLSLSKEQLEKLYHRNKDKIINIEEWETEIRNVARTD